MFTQLLGSYLLNNNYINVTQLTDAIEYQKDIHVKLGVLAVNYGFMTAKDIETVHNIQKTRDKKFGEIAIEMGFLDNEKLENLLNTQKSDFLLLGQALIEKKYMTLEQFETAINNYKNENSITNEKFKLLQNDDIDQIIETYYNFNNSKSSSIYKYYLSILLKNIIRFIDPNFRILDIKKIEHYNAKWAASQKIVGTNILTTYAAADEKPFINFAAEFADEKFSIMDEYVKASIGEFLNQVNGIYIVNMSNDGFELQLTPQDLIPFCNLQKLPEAFCISLEFSFGQIDFIIENEK